MIIHELTRQGQLIYALDRMELPHFMAAEGKRRSWAASVRGFGFVKMLHDSAPASTSLVLVPGLAEQQDCTGGF